MLSFSYITTFGFHFIFYEVYWEENVLLWGTWQNYRSNWMIKLASECKWCLWKWRKEQTVSQGLVHPLGISWQWMTHPKEQNSLTWKYRAVSSTSKPLLANITSSKWGGRRLRSRKMLTLRSLELRVGSYLALEPWDQIKVPWTERSRPWTAQWVFPYLVLGKGFLPSYWVLPIIHSAEKLTG